jgi:hypothetical protein
MPCQTYTRADEIDDERRYALQDEADAATRAACELVRVLRDNYPKVTERMFTSKLNGIATKGIPLLSSKTIAWVKRHKHEDELRLSKEELRKKQERLKKRALAKLTSKERKLLGLV